jgi:hypothetical protein
MPSQPSQVYFELFRNSSLSADMNVDGSVTPVVFEVVATQRIYVQRVNFEIVDGSITPTKFAGLTALTNGVLVRIVDSDDNVLKDFLDGETIKQNSDWSLLAGSDVPITAAAGDDELPIRWTVSKGTGDALELSDGEKF